MAAIDDPRRLDLDALTVTLVPAALGFAGAVFGALGAPSVAAARSDHFLWLATALAIPGLVLFVLRFPDRPLPAVWRSFWTLAALAWLGHAHYHFRTIFGDDLRLFLSVEGLVPTILAVAATGFWIADVVLAWATRQGTVLILVLRSLAHLLVLAALVLEGLEAARAGVALAVLMLLATLVAGAIRLRRA